MRPSPGVKALGPLGWCHRRLSTTKSCSERKHAIRAPSTWDLPAEQQAPPQPTQSAASWPLCHSAVHQQLLLHPPPLLLYRQPQPHCRRLLLLLQQLLLTVCAHQCLCLACCCCWWCGRVLRGQFLAGWRVGSLKVSQHAAHAKANTGRINQLLRVLFILVVRLQLSLACLKFDSSVEC